MTNSTNKSSSLSVDELFKDRDLLAKKRAVALKKRNRAEKRFQWAGRLSIVFGIACVLFLFTDIISKGTGAFTQTYVDLEITFDQDELGLTPQSTEKEIKAASFGSFSKKTLRKLFPEITGRKQKRELYAIFTSDMPLILRNMVLDDPSILGSTKTVSIVADDDFDTYYKHSYGRDLAEEDVISRLSDMQEGLVDTLVKSGAVTKRFNTILFSNSASREPELAGIKGAVIGSLLTLLVTLALSFPIAVATAIYLEEFAPTNRITDFIEVNINNLAAVPSVIFGFSAISWWLRAYSDDLANYYYFEPCSN